MKLSRQLSPKLEDASTALFSETPDTLSDSERTQFLDMVAMGDTQHRAASKMHVPFWVVGATRKLDERFDSAVQLAVQIRDLLIGDMVEETLVDQAINGYEEDVYHMGFVVGTRRVYGNNGNAQFVLRGLKRDKYGTDRTEQTLRVTDTPPPAVRDDRDAQKLLAKLHADLRPVIEGQFVEVKQTNDGSDLI